MLSCFWIFVHNKHLRYFREENKTIVIRKTFHAVNPRVISISKLLITPGGKDFISNKIHV